MPTIKDKMPNSVHVRDLRGKVGEVLDRVIGGERITVTRFGRPIAVLVPIEDYERWLKMDELDLGAVIKALGEVEGGDVKLPSGEFALSRDESGKVVLRPLTKAEQQAVETEERGEYGAGE